MNYRIICAICFVLMCWAPDLLAQRKGLLSSDQLLEMALEETNKNRNYEKAISLCRKALAQSPGYTDVKLLLGRLYLLTGNVPAARLEWLEVLKKTPPDRQALDYLINLESSQGRTTEAICYIDIALEKDPFNKELLFKKHGILQDHKKQADADKILAVLTARYPSDPKVRAMNSEAAEAKAREEKAAQPAEESRKPVITAEEAAMYKLETAMVAARKKNDVAQQRTIAQKMLQLEPARRDAYLMLINSHHGARQYEAALQWCNRALEHFHDDEDLLRRKTGLLQELHRTGEAAAITHRLLRATGSPRDLQAYRDIQLQRAAAYDKAGNFTAAAGVVDSLLAYAPADTLLLFRKAGLLEAAQQYENAAAISKQLMKITPGNSRYSRAYADQQTMAAYAYLRRNEPAKARPLLEEALHYPPAGKDVWTALINLENAAGHTTKAISLCDDALASLGPAPELLQKKSALLQSANRMRDAYGISGALVRQYPGNVTFRQMYTDQLMAHGRQLQQLQAWDTAQLVLREAYKYQPEDTLLLQQLVNNFLALQQYDSAAAYADKGLQLQAGHPGLLMKKAAAQEAMKDYSGAAATVAALQRLQPGNKELQHYRLLLQSKTYRNQAGIIHLQSIYDNGNRPANVTALQYLRFHNRGSVGGRISYADRPGGSGVQLEAETYYTHNKKYYSYGMFGWSGSEVFPRIRAGYSLFRNLGKDWEAELGARYLKTDSAANYAAVWSAGKLWNRYWANLRGYVITEDGNWYQAYTLTNRFYVGERKDFISFTLSLGNTPDDRARNYQFNNNASFLAGGAGLGFLKTFAYRTSLGLFGNWTYQRLTNKAHYNQYDIYLSLLHNF